MNVPLQRYQIRVFLQCIAVRSINQLRITDPCDPDRADDKWFYTGDKSFYSDHIPFYDDHKSFLSDQKWFYSGDIRVLQFLLNLKFYILYFISSAAVKNLFRIL